MQTKARKWKVAVSTVAILSIFTFFMVLTNVPPIPKALRPFRLVRHAETTPWTTLASGEEINSTMDIFRVTLSRQELIDVLTKKLGVAPKEQQAGWVDVGKGSKVNMPAQTSFRVPNGVIHIESRDAYAKDPVVVLLRTNRRSVVVAKVHAFWNGVKKLLGRP